MEDNKAYLRWMGCKFENHFTKKTYVICGMLSDSYLPCSGPKLMFEPVPQLIPTTDISWIGAYSFERALDDGLIKLVS